MSFGETQTHFSPSLGGMDRILEQENEKHIKTSWTVPGSDEVDGEACGKTSFEVENKLG
jgi:hypothetical protein